MVKEKGEGKELGENKYLVLAVIAAVPIWFAISFYCNAIGVGEEEIVSTIGTVFFIGGVFVGRYLAILWLEEGVKVSRQLLISLGLVVVVCIVWLFIHGDFPFRHHQALNLLAYWVPFLLASLALGVLIKLARSVDQSELRKAQAVTASTQSELHLLQSQLSPHFLFNTLNNLYGLSLTQHQKIPPLLLRLSDLLRYSVYDANELFVSLKDELAYIDNYVEFEKIRIGDRLKLTIDIEKISDPSIKIAPMLLIVFIENAFKHSKNTIEDKISVELSLRIWGTSILFSVKNSQNKTTEENSITAKSSGFGLVNVKKRLELLYPNRYVLEIENEEDRYSVSLLLKMK